MRFKIVLFFAVLTFHSLSGLVATEFLPSFLYSFRLAGIAGDAIMIALGATVLFRNRGYYGAKAFLLFCFASLITILYHEDSLGVVAQLNGLRQPLPFLGALVFVHDVANNELWASFSKWFTRFLVGYALIQIPVSVWQFLKYGAGDPVGGTYGLTGGSGLITQQAFLISFFLIASFAALPDGSGFVVRRAVPYLVLLIPCALNETKVSFILLPAFIVLLSMTRKQWYKTIPLVAIGGALIYLLNFYYSKTAEDSSKILNVQFAEKYLYYDVQEGEDLPRFARFPIMFRLMDYDPLEITIGLGYGLFLGNDILGPTRLTRSLTYLQGSKILLFTSWIQGGLLAILILCFSSAVFVRSPYIQSFATRRFAYFLFFSIVLSWFYNEALLDRAFAPMVAYLIVWAEMGGKQSESRPEAESEVTAVEPAMSA
ncbi:MAG TPA: hypothetical protein VMG09_02620 [Bacteroidota bacterium]|nr:hypothetical protein [Bacteroidota bacterium]